MIAHLYLRFSHSDQAAGTSIARQRTLCERLCERKGWEVGETYIDRAKSASKGRNRVKGGALFEFEAEARAGFHHGSVLVVEKLDRISRQGYDATRDFIAELGRHGVSVATEDGAFYRAGEPIDVLRVIEMLIKAETAREEAAKRADRTRMRHELQRERAEREGAAMGKLAPAWLTIKNGRYVAIKERAALVVRMFEMADAGDGALTIAKKLNAEGVPVWQRWESRPIRAWDRTRIRKILADDSVLGWRRGKGEPIKLYPEIVAPDVFERVRAAASIKAETRGGSRSSVVANLVSGLATCTVCGSPMMYIRHRSAGSLYKTKPAGNMCVLKHDSATLMCRAAHQHGCTNRAAITYYGFEKALLDAALHIILDDRAFTKADELGRINEELARKTSDFEVAKSSAERLWQSWAESAEAGAASDMRERLATNAETRAKALKVEMEALAAAKAKAAGQASAAEHLSRIEQVRSHLYDDDLDVRAQHRKKVMEGLRTVVTHIWCDENKVATIAFAGGLAALQIHRGKVIAKGDATAMFTSDDYTALGDDRAQRAATMIVKRAEKTNGRAVQRHRLTAPLDTFVGG